MRKVIIISILAIAGLLSGYIVAHYTVNSEFFTLNECGKLDCKCAEYNFIEDYIKYVNVKVNTDFVDYKEGYYNENEERKNVQDYAEKLAHEHIDEIFKTHSRDKVIEYLKKKTGAKTEKDVYLYYANKVVEEYSKEMKWKITSDDDYIDKDFEEKLKKYEYLLDVK